MGINLIAFIPARSGSKRIPHKNIRFLNGHPLLAYSIQAAKDSGIFDRIYCSSDSEEILRIAEYYGAKGIFCPLEIAHKDNDPDVKWITHALKGFFGDAFMILRPTSPFRTSETIKRAWRKWDKEHCMKAIQKVSEHPQKMWQIANKKKTLMFSTFTGDNEHLLPTQSLDKFYIQNACIEIRPIENINGKDSIYQFFFTKNREGFDLNFPDDWILAEALVERGLVKLTKIEKESYETTL